jgi:hypothetical protein
MITEERINKALNYLRESAEKAAQARATRLYLEDFTKHLKAKLARGFDGSNANQIMLAESSDEFKAHLDALRIAIEQDELFRHMIHAADTYVEVWRSEKATERALGMVK